MKTITASVIVPIRNEEKYIGACLKSLLQQSVPSDSYEIIVVDGRSSDRSKEIVEGIQHDFLNVRCIDNPTAIAPAAMNIGIRNARGKIIIRADGHNFYPPNYIENCVKYLEQTGADNVGGPWLTKAEFRGRRLWNWSYQRVQGFCTFRYFDLGQRKVKPLFTATCISLSWRLSCTSGD